MSWQTDVGADQKDLDDKKARLDEIQARKAQLEEEMKRLDLGLRLDSSLLFGSRLLLSLPLLLPSPDISSSPLFVLFLSFSRPRGKEEPEEKMTQSSETPLRVLDNLDAKCTRGLLCARSHAWWLRVVVTSWRRKRRRRN